MKKMFSILVTLLLSISVFAQAPQKMSYQAVIRNTSNQLVVNKTVGMKISILQASVSGTLVYSETQTPTTNANGLISIEIGGGTGFDIINWATGPYFIKTETDPTGGTSYTITGTSQLLSVPYAIYSSNGFASDYNENNIPVKNSDGSVSIGIVPNKDWTNIGWGSLKVGGQITFLPGSMSWGCQLGLIAHSLPGGKDYSINSLGGDAGEGQGKFVIAGPSGGVLLIDSLGNTGIGTVYPAAKLQVSKGDIFIDQINSGVIMKSPDGSSWRMTVENTGSPKFTKINDPSASVIITSEVWGVIMNNDSTNYGQEIFEKKMDGSITAKGNWHVNGVDCPFQNSIVTINGTNMSFTAIGTATNPVAPSPYNTSPFTLNVTGSAHDGISTATWSINFSTYGWPSTVQGVGSAVKKSGSGVTN